MAPQIAAGARSLKSLAAAAAGHLVLGAPGALAAVCMVAAAWLVYRPAALVVAALYLHAIDWRIR